MMSPNYSPTATPPAVTDYPPASVMRKGRVLAMLASNPELPTPPAIALQVIEKASDCDCDPNDLGDIISKDPALCAKVLRTVNSAVYGLRKPMTSVPAAVRYLGVHPLRSLVLAFTLSNVRWSPLPRKMLQTHWRVSVAGAIAARQLAVLARRPGPDNDLVAGLVRDLGVLVLNQLFPDEYTTILQASPEAFSAFQCDLEEEALGMNHAEVSAELLRHWHMPAEITDPIRYHHDLDRANELTGELRDRARLLYLASQIGQLQVHASRPMLVRETLGLAKEFCNLDEQGFRAFLQSLSAQTSEFAKAMEVDTGESIDLSAVVNRGVQEFARLAVSGSGQHRVVSKSAIANAMAARQQSPAATHLEQRPPATAPVCDTSKTMVDRPAPQPMPGKPAGYEPVEVLGKGAMGVVYRAIDPRLQREVAIKAMLTYRAGDPLARERFLREGRAVAALAHENVVRIHAVGEEDGVPYLVMEYVKGTTVASKLPRGKPLPLPDILRLGLDTASGLSAAHAKGLIHRDIKPANLLVDGATGRIKIADFGLAQGGGQAQIKKEQGVAGTPHYMSPEQAEGLRVDPASDMFSLGSVLYLACTGRLPFEGDNVLDVMRAVCETTPIPIRTRNPALPTWLEEVVAGLLTKDPTKRYPTAAELRRLLLSRLARLYTRRGEEGTP